MVQWVCGRRLQCFSMKTTTVALLSFTTLLTVFYYVHDYRPCREPGRATPPRREYKARGNVDSLSYDHNLPIIFIGGFPRSGTTLMRALLDAHPHVRCGEETRVIPRVLGMRNQWKRSDKENKRLKEAGLTDEVLDSALTAFILEIIVKHGEPAPRLCNKDPFTLKSGVYLSTLFPKAKFLFMVRDGRAVVNSIISRQVTITGFDLTDQRTCLSKWSKSVEHMYLECQQIGNSRCLPVFYEQLVLQPRKWMQIILTFLELPWQEAVLHHEDYIEKPGGIALSKTEKSTDQIVKPVNTDALSKWVGKFPPKIVNDMANIAPMLQKLGYDPGANPPKYGQPEQSKSTENQRINSKKLYSS